MGDMTNAYNILIRYLKGNKPHGRARKFGRIILK
jgi:hypothetical protein